MNFRDFLFTHLDSDCPIGDLARDAKQDSGWTGNTVKSLKDRLENNGACEGAWEAFKNARKLFADSKKQVKEID